MRNIFEYQDSLHLADDKPARLKWGKISTQKPLISILMPVYNHPKYFEEALLSAINQDFDHPYEIVVLDNNLDNDFEYKNEFEAFVEKQNCHKVLYYKNVENIGGINSYNRLPQICNADYFVFLHDDDMLCEDCLSALWEIKEKNRLTREIVIPQIYHIDENSQSRKSPSRWGNKYLWYKSIESGYRAKPYDMLICSFTNGGGCLHHTATFLELGGYSHEFIPSADYALYIAYMCKHGAYISHKSLFKYRSSAESDTSKVFLECRKRDMWFRTCLMPYIKLPQTLLRKIIEAYNITEKYRNEMKWKGHSDVKPSYSNRLYIYLSIILKNLTHLF